jgi:integrase
MRKPSLGTRKAYRYTLDELEREGMTAPSDVTCKRVAAWVLDLHRRELSPKTIASKLACLTSVLGQLSLEGAFEETEIIRIRRLMPRGRMANPNPVRILSLTEIDRLLDGVRRIAPRAEFPIRVGLLTGCRSGELVRLRREDFTLGKGPHLRVQELPEYAEKGTIKTGRARVVPVSRELKALVRKDAPSEGWLFPTADRSGAGKPPTTPFLSVQSLERDVRLVRQAVGLSDDVVLTTLRHTRASSWLAAGVSIWKVASWLGHQVRVCEQFYGRAIPGWDPDCERAVYAETPL